MKPTIARIVHFHANNGQDPEQAAIVVAKLPEDRIRLQVFTPSGGRFQADLPAEPNSPNHQGYSWSWPPRE